MASNTTRILSLAARKNGGVSVSQLTAASIRARSTILPAYLSSNNGILLDNFTKRWNSNYPSHEVVGMPSLSPVSGYIRNGIHTIFGHWYTFLTSSHKTSFTKNK